MKGQAAMEYLMTYGWALLVIVIVLAVLLIINPFRSPEQCSFSDVSLACGKPLIQDIASSTDGQLYLQVTNGFAQAIQIKGAICTNDKQDPVAPAPFVTPLNIPGQGVITFRSNTPAIDPAKGEIDLKCTKPGGAAVVAGEDYTGRIFIYFNLADDPTTYPVRVAKGTLTAKVQS